jgi:hypothetical protein
MRIDSKLFRFLNFTTWKEVAPSIHDHYRRNMLEYASETQQCMYYKREAVATSWIFNISCINISCTIQFAQHFNRLWQLMSRVSLHTAPNRHGNRIDPVECQDSLIPRMRPPLLALLTKQTSRIWPGFIKTAFQTPIAEIHDNGNIPWRGLFRSLMRSRPSTVTRQHNARARFVLYQPQQRAYLIVEAIPNFCISSFRSPAHPSCIKAQSIRKSLNVPIQTRTSTKKILRKKKTKPTKCLITLWWRWASGESHLAHRVGFL